MSEEDKNLLARIGQLAGQINRARMQQSGASPSSPGLHPLHHRANARHRGHDRFRIARTHRHRTLVLNNSSSNSASHTPESGPATPTPAPTSTPDGTVASQTTQSWVSRNDRHRQLINSAVYGNESQARIKALEKTRQQKLLARHHKEKSRIMNYLAHSGLAKPAPSLGSSRDLPVFEIEGIPFIVTKNGSKLVRSPDYPANGTPTPKTAVVAGVTFFRSKNGNLYRHGIVKSQRQKSGVTKSGELCKTFSSSGSCPKGPSCRYTHDASKVALCKDFVKGACASGDECDLSHDAAPERTPACVHFAKGNCTNPNCVYIHSSVSAGAPVCRAFGLYGYCERGATCSDRHVFFECPDFSNTGKCKTKGCKLLHRERASVLRKKSSAANGDDDAAEDLSSDEESVASDDVDSDEVEEFIEGELDDTDFQDQKEFIAF